jgi:tetratricopeptide (TPR) repeat protein
MSEAPQEVQLPLAEFDRSQLPVEQRELNGDDFREAVREHLSAQFADQGGAAQIVVTDDRIIMRWTDNTEPKSLSHVGIEQLKAGNLEKGVATLRVALQRNPNDLDALYNLGMALTEVGEIEEAIRVLEGLLNLESQHAPGWTALGVAQSTAGREDEAVASFAKATEFAPNDGHAHKNLGALMAKLGHTAAAMPSLAKAVALLPDNAQAWINLAMALEQTEQWNAADAAYQNVMRLEGNGELGQRAEEGRSRIAAALFHNQTTGPRPDAISYCLDALERFEGMPQPEVQKIAFEIAMLGSRGINLNDPEKTHTLQSLPGTFSGLHLLCLQYVGFQLLDPTIDVGIDLSAEYQAAIEIHRRK